MTRFLLLRHAAHDWIGRGVPGRMPDVALNAQGQREAAGLAARLQLREIDAIYSSPQQRAQETAAPMATARDLPIQRADAFAEIEFGDWSGKSFQQLDLEPEWRVWVERRSAAAPPGGETLAQVRERAMAGIEQLRRAHPDQSVLVVSHGDVIKVVLAEVLGLSLDHLERFDIAPASLSIIDSAPGWSQVKLVNGQ